MLTDTERVKRIIEMAKFYNSDNGITRGLVFCSRVDESTMLSENLTKKDLKRSLYQGKIQKGIGLMRLSYWKQREIQESIIFSRLIYLMKV